MKKAYLAGGCFWCIESALENVKGVQKVISGYSGGREVNPSYADVKAQKTHHRETVEVWFDGISYRDVLQGFFENVDPFDDGGQFIDRGRSYTLAVYYATDEEKEIATAFLREKQQGEARKIQIAVEPFTGFFVAEEEHQEYGKKHPELLEKEILESGRKAK